MKLVHPLSFICATLAGTQVIAHEFWIEPLKFQVEKEESIQADLRNGQLFSGSAQPFFPQRNTRFDAVTGDKAVEVTGRMGDRPAIQLPAPQNEGLLILVHEAAPSIVTYREWPKFVAFTEHKDFTTALADHETRRWDKENFKESYTRHSKALVAVGSGAGADRALGLATEFVALDNPYAADFDGTLDVALFYDGAPLADAQIEIYAKTPDNIVTVTKTRTDSEGHAALPVEPGLTYLLDAVVLRPFAQATPAAQGPVWETLWASLTFAVPAK